MSAIQQSSFAPVTAYDAPNVLFTQLLEDEATFESFLDTFLDDSQLTPKQRDSYVDRLKAEYGGGNKVQEALIGVATNPLVLLGFLISPQIGRNLANNGQAFQHFVKGADGLGFMALKNFKQMFQNTPLDPALRQVANSVRLSNRIFDDIMVPAEEKFIKQFGITRNQFHDTASIPDKSMRRRVERLKRMMVADMDGQLLSSAEDRTAVLRDMNINLVSRDGTTKTFTLNQDALAEVAESFGAKGLNSDERRALLTYQKYLNSDEIEQATQNLSLSLRDQLLGAASRTVDNFRGVTPASEYGLVKLSDYQAVRNSAAFKALIPQKTVSGAAKFDGRKSDVSLLRKVLEKVDPKAKAYISQQDIAGMTVSPNFVMRDAAGKVKNPSFEEGKVAFDGVFISLDDSIKDSGLLGIKKRVVNFKDAATSGPMIEEFETKTGDTFRDAIEKAYPGYFEFKSSIQQTLDTQFARMYGKSNVTAADIREFRQMDLATREARAAEILDTEKIVRIKDGLQNRSNYGFTEGDAFIDRLLSQDTRDLMYAGKLSNNDFTKEIRRGFAATVVSNYLPRNTSEFYKMRTPVGATLETLGDLRSRLTLLAPDETPAGVAGTGRLVATNRQVQRQGRQVMHPDDIDALEADFRALNLEPVKREIQLGKDVEINTVFDDLRFASQKAMQAAQDDTIALRRLDLSKTLFRSRSSSAKDYALFIEAPGTNVIAAQRNIIPNISDTYGNQKLPAPYKEKKGGLVFGTDKIPLMQVFDKTGTQAPPGGFNLAHVLEQGSELIAYGGRNDPNSVARGVKARELLSEVAIPKALGVQNERTGLGRLVIGTAQAQASRMKNSAFMRGIGSMGPFGKAVREQVEYFAQADTGALASATQANASGYLYTSHLGLNVASVIQNLTQPFLHASAYVGTGNVLRGYKGTFDDLYRYAQNRQKIKQAQLTPFQKERLIQESFEFPDETGLTSGILDDLDRLVANRGMEVSKFKFYTQELPMLLFEKGEWVNRITATHSMKNAYIRQGLAKRGADGRAIFSNKATRESFARDASFLVEETQFGSDILNTPALFMQGTSKVLNTPALLENPLIRQFQTFSLRAPLALMFTGRMLGATRGVRGTRVELPYLLGDSMRMLGTSALIYEAGKPFAFDPSSGGAVTAMTQFFNPERLAEGKFPMRGPPIVSIATDSMQGLLGGDMNLVVNAAVRTLPGGLAIQRAMGSLPNLRDDPFLSFIGEAQKTYADYSKINSDGRVPVFKGTGQLVDYQSPTEMVLRGLGINMAGVRNTRDIDGYISSQREKFNQMRRSYLDHLFANNVGKAESIRGQFKRIYGFDLPVTKQQVDSYIRQREVPRSERMMDRLPVELKSYFRQTLDPERLQLTQQQLQMKTSFERTAQQAERAPVAVTPELAAQLQREIAATEQQRELFEGFTGF